MTCQTIQNKVLALPDPRQVPEPLRDHLDGCAACQAWWRQAVRLERLLENLPTPTPPADKKAVMIDELTTAGPVIKSVPAAARRANGNRFAAVFGTSTAKYVAGLAAAILVGVGGWQLFKPAGSPVVAKESPRHPLLEKVVQRDVALAKAGSPAERLDVLGGLAEDFATEARSLARVGSAEDLDELARWFDKVVRDGIGQQADHLPPGMNRADKKALLDRLTAKLAETGQEADRAIPTAPPQSKAALEKIKYSARDGQAKLREILAREGT